MGTIADLNNLTTPAANDFWVVRDVSDVLDPDKKVMLGEFGLIDLPNTWTGNQAINSTATSGSALSVTRNLAAGNTDAPVVDIVQDHASDDQIALRIRQDGTAIALDITADSVGSNGFAMRNLNAGTGAHNRVILNALGGDPFFLLQSGATPTNWAVGVDTSDAAKFKIGSASALGTIDRFIIETTGNIIIPGGANVGIGTGAPFNLLHVRASAVTGADSSSADLLVVENNSNTNLNLIANPGFASQVLFSDDVRAQGMVSYNHVTDAMSFSTAGTVSMTIDPAGFVGIGTPSPFNFLHVRKVAVPNADSNVDDIFVLEYNGNNSFNIISSTVGVGQFCFSDDVRARGLFQYNHATDSLTIRTNGANVMTIDSAGAPAFPLMTVLAGTAVHASAAGVLTKATSSQRYKRNIRDLSEDYGDIFIKALRPVLYQERRGFVGDELVEYGEKDKSPDRVGLISEEVYAASGEAFVMLDADGKPDGLSYERLVAPLIGAIQRLMARVEKLEMQLSA